MSPSSSENRNPIPFRSIRAHDHALPSLTFELIHRRDKPAGVSGCERPGSDSHPAPQERPAIVSKRSLASSAIVRPKDVNEDDPHVGVGNQPADLHPRPAVEPVYAAGWAGFDNKLFIWLDLSGNRRMVEPSSRAGVFLHADRRPARHETRIPEAARASGPSPCCSLTPGDLRHATAPHS